MIREAIPEDAPALALVGSATFLETYGHFLPGPDLVDYCARFHSIESYRAWIQEPDTAIWVTLAGGGMVVGFAMTSPSDLPEARPDDLELKKLYVLATFKGKGMGKRLLQAAIERATSRGACRLTLGVYSGNREAIQFYEKSGFQPIGIRPFLVGDKQYENLVLALDL